MIPLPLWLQIVIVALVAVAAVYQEIQDWKDRKQIAESDATHKDFKGGPTA